MVSSELDLTVKRLRSVLKRYGDAIPGLWKAIDETRLHSAMWPPWCFVPIELVRALLVSAAETSGFHDPKPLLSDLVSVTTLAAWRTTQGIYVFDPDVQQDVWNTPLGGDIPSAVLVHLPEWCCFVSTPGPIFGEDVLGFFVSLNSDSSELRPELWFLVVYKDEAADVEPLCLTLVGSVNDAIAGGLAKLHRTAQTVSAERKQIALERLNARYGDHSRDLEGMISLALYLASENAEIFNAEGQAPQRPAPKKTKNGPRIFAPPTPRMWGVGIRLGAALRAARTHDKGDGSQMLIERSSPRGHIRRAHWHSFWSGPRGTEQQVLRVKWLPPIAVNLPDIEALPATIRKVGGRHA